MPLLVSDTDRIGETHVAALEIGKFTASPVCRNEVKLYIF
jgi:hypothetical protein